jgi:hypothetical protein
VRCRLQTTESVSCPVAHVRDSINNKTTNTSSVRGEARAAESTSHTAASMCPSTAHTSMCRQAESGPSACHHTEHCPRCPHVRTKVGEEIKTQNIQATRHNRHSGQGTDRRSGGAMRTRQIPALLHKIQNPQVVQCLGARWVH